MKIYLTSVAANVLKQVVSSMGIDAHKLKVAFIPTAGNPYPSREWIDQDRNALLSLGFTVFDVDVATKTEKELREILKSVDIVFVAGGNTFYLLEKVRKSCFDNLIKDFISQNKIYIGSSAGSIIIAPDIKFAEVFDDPSIADLKSTKGINIINFIPVPHYKKGNARYEAVIRKYKDKYTMIPLRDDQFIFVNEDGYTIHEKENS